MPKKSSLVPLYYALAAAGLITTWYYNLQYLAGGGGLLPHQFFGTAFANVLTTAITIDIYISALVYSLWLVIDSGRTGVRWPWLYVVLCFCAGLAFSLPLYLAAREKQILKSDTAR